MGAAWGVAPAIARVHAYLMARGESLTEREVREALGLSHRAASLALAEAEAWGLVERVAEPRRVGRRGPAGTAYMAIGDHWRWFGRVVAERKVREGDPIIVVLERTLADTQIALAQHPDDVDLLRLRDWLSTFLIFVRLFDRAVGLVSRLEPTELERAVRLLGEVPDDTILRLITLLDGLPDEDVLGLVEALSPPLAGIRTPRHEADVRGRRRRSSGSRASARIQRDSRRRRAIIALVTSDRTGSNGRRPRGKPDGRPLTRPLGEPKPP